MLVIWLLQPIAFKWRKNSPSTDFASKQSRHLNALYHFGPVMLVNRKFDIFSLASLTHCITYSKYFSESIALKSKLKFCHTVQSPRGAFSGISPSKTKLKTPNPNWNMKHYKTVMFVQISECQAPLHKCTVKLPYRDFLLTVLLPHQVFHWPFFWQQWLDFNTIREFTFKFYFGA